MSQAKLSTRRHRQAAVVTLICAAVFLVTGCVTITHSGSTTNVTFWKRATDTMIGWNDSSQCAQDVNGDGEITITDRARCALFLTRLNICNHLSGADHLYCYAGTDPAKYDVQFAYAVHGRKVTGNPCLAFQIKPGSVVEWGSYRYGQLACQY
jgi:hypothetical protein